MVQDTEGVGPCHGGHQTCTAAGQWGNCDGEVIPVGETCGDGLDNNCNGSVDENEDRDGDGFSTCDGDCCDSTECGTPANANPGAFDSPGNMVDDDCDGTPDNTLLLCDQGLTSNTNNAKDFAKAIDLCQEATPGDKKWGVLEASLTLPSGSGVPDAVSHSIRPKFGAAVPRGGVSMALLSTGAAAAVGDTNPNFAAQYGGMKTSAFPSDFVGAHGGKLPNAPDCPEPNGNVGHDPVMLTIKVRVPTNAHSFSLTSNFYSYEFPEFTCSPYNDFFVVLLDSAYAGNPANPMDKNLAFYTKPGTQENFPVGVNLAHGNTGLFTQCMNGNTGCEPLFDTVAGSINTCTSTADLIGTGFDAPSNRCDPNVMSGGATGWLTTSGNVNPGETITLRIAIWDTSDAALDSTALIDGFTWSVDSTQPGTVILRADSPENPMAVEAPFTSSAAL